MHRLHPFLPALLLFASCVTYTPQPIDSTALAKSFLARELDTTATRDFFAQHARPWPTGEWNVEDLWLATLCCNQQLAAARAEVKIAIARRELAGERPNPRLSIVPEWAANADPGVSPWVLGIGLAIPLELGGKREARIALAERELDLAAFRAASSLWDAREQLVASCLAHEHALAALDLAQREQTVFERFAADSARRVSAGATAKDEAMLADLANARASAAVATAKAEVQQTRTQLAAAIGLPEHALATTKLARRFARPDPSGWTEEDLRRIALGARVDIQEQLADYAVQEADLCLEVKKQYPDLEVGPGYQYDQGQHKIQLGLSFELPLFHNNDAAIAVAEASREAAAKRFEATQARAIGEVEQAVAAHAAAKEALLAATSTQDLQRRATTRAGVRLESGQDDARMFLASLRDELLGERELLTARTNADTAALQLERTIGLPLQAATKHTETPR
jgi:outer membrane protein, heavy metal efflux system